jgi:hypothetical protein
MSLNRFCGTDAAHCPKHVHRDNYRRNGEYVTLANKAWNDGTFTEFVMILTLIIFNSWSLPDLPTWLVSTKQEIAAKLGSDRTFKH